MSHAGPASDPHILLASWAQAAACACSYADAARAKIAARLAPDGKVDRLALDREQHAAHGLAWIATYAQTLTQTADWGASLQAQGRFGQTEQVLGTLLFGEYLAQLIGGLPMTQLEMVRPADLELEEAAAILASNSHVAGLLPGPHSAGLRAQAARLLLAGRGRACVEDPGLDETENLIRDQFRQYAREQIEPHAHGWHLRDELIPLEIITQLGELGVFGLTIPEEYGGMGLGKTAMCIVSEELSRGYIGVGSLATRTEIAAELILTGGTSQQKSHWLPMLANAQILPTAVFTEPNTGSDLGALRTRAQLVGDQWRVSGNKTWITHAARADLMTLLVRTAPDTHDFRGLSMLLAPKARGEVGNQFPSPGMTGGEIEVLGYRGMKEYELAFDDFAVPAENLLGGVEGQGFRQLMATFESARIQTAARAIGVAQCAYELGLTYALERVQFGQPIFDFPRTADKLVMMAAELIGCRQITYFSARQKDSGKRCDLEAGMAKLLAARVAWSAADNALQIHGGNGFALEYPISRVLCDARILNIFEGAGEIQAQVIARRLLEG